mmetsp:Transcript_16111/g.32855  ORF Transcript_16111/g.32855 Transcript_16111/m.32855 type:complete len:380 (+) Transcript_16111:212-1351(+)
MKPSGSHTQLPQITPVTASPFTPFQLMLLSLMVMQNSSVVLLGRATQAGVDPEDKFNVKTLVALTEATKLAACFFLIGMENLVERFPPVRGAGYLPDLSVPGIIGALPAAIFEEISKVVASPKNSLVVSPPAALYLFQNNILYVALANLPAPVFQVCYQSKLVTTAIVSVILLNRQYAKLQWIALVCLGVGVALVVLGESSSEGEVKDINLSVGLIAVALASLSSAFAGVWFEKVVKGVSAGANGGPAKTTSLWVRNVELAFFSLVFASAYGAWESMMKAPEEAIDAPTKPFLHGFTFTTYILVLLQAGGGLLVAAIVKYADNVVKGLATGVAVVVSTTFSCMFLGTEVKMQFLLGGMIILVSVWTFSNHTKASSMLNC